MSSPEKRDERSMSDILASIRKIMAQEPAKGAPPSPARPAANAQSGPRELPREPELKMPPLKTPENAPSPPPAAKGGPEPVSLDELLAETSQTSAPKSGLGPGSNLGPSPGPSLSRPEPATPAAAPAPRSEPRPEPQLKAPDAPWLQGRPGLSEPAKSAPPAGNAAAKSDTPGMAQGPARGVIPAPPGSPAAPPIPMGGPTAAQPAAPARGTPEPRNLSGAAPALDKVTPPAPKLADLGSVVPGQMGTGAAPPLAGPGLAARTGDPAASTAERTPLAPQPAAGPLLGDAPRGSRTESAADVPGADALRRLIAGVAPTKAQVGGSVRPAEAPPAAAKSDAPKIDASKSEVKSAVSTSETGAPQGGIKGPIGGAAPVAPKVAGPSSGGTATKAPAPSTPPATPVNSAPGGAPSPRPGASPSLSMPAAAPKAAPPPPAAVPKADPASVSPPARAVSAPAASPKSMEETVVELLRPLLREWLDTNMPRLIEPALRAELEARRTTPAPDEKS